MGDGVGTAGAARSLPEAALPGTDGSYAADVVIVGAGVAGLMAAHHLPDELDVLVLDKGVAGRSGSSPWAQGGLAAAIGPDDSPELHARDTHVAGDGLCDAAAVRVLAEEGPARVEELLELGAQLDGHDGMATTLAELHLAREGAQAVARSVHRADATGRELVATLRRAVVPRVRRLECAVVGLSVRPGGVVDGCWVLDGDGALVAVRARAVLLASGGCGGLFAATTNQDGATADGVSLAWWAGAAVRDMEFVQFHPTGLAVEGAWRFLLTEALRGAGATLHDADGERFMPDVHPDAELAPRHVVARAIVDQPGGLAWLDATHLGLDRLEHEFPTVLHGARGYGFDLATERVPVTPAAHYMVGGIRTDLHARTSLDGLWAAGEVASTGVHGANRMAGNSLTEALVFGTRAARSIAAELRPPDDVALTARPALAPSPPSGVDLEAVRTRLRELMWADAGPVRDADRLARAAAGLLEVADALGPRSHDRDHAELHAALAAAQLVVSNAMARTESRGGHQRLDHPDPQSSWSDTHLERLRPAPSGRSR